jgi:hypothetical protein
MPEGQRRIRDNPPDKAPLNPPGRGSDTALNDMTHEQRTVKHASRRRRAWLKNPIIFARQLRAELDAMPNGNQSTLAERHGVTRTWICQYLRLLDLPDEIVDFIGDPENEATTGTITEAALRVLLSLHPAYEQMQAFARIGAGYPASPEGARDGNKLES